MTAVATESPRSVVHLELARPADMFETPVVELGSTIGGFSPGVDRCLAELAAHPAHTGLRLDIAVPPDEITPDLADRMTITLRRYCTERLHLNACTRGSTMRSGLRAFRIGLPVTFVGLAITAGATRIGDIDDALRAVIDIIGWVLAWVGLWYPFDKVLFYPLDDLRESRSLTQLRDADIRIVAIGTDNTGTQICASPRMTKPRTPDALRRRGLHLEWATNGWNVLEVVVTIWLGIAAGSLALIAFGLDSVVEIFASTVVIRNLHEERFDPGDRRVHRSLRMIAVAFWLLAAFLVVLSVRGLVRGDRPDGSPVGVGYLALTAVVMFGLARLKRTTAAELRSEPLEAEAALTFLDGCLSTGILVALVLNEWLGWWWADATAALLVAAFAVNEGVRHWRESAPHEDRPAT